ncbi:PKD domain-containing protein [Kitasatospora sp. NPDC058115]|uniref:PKD domain-containing protein n=1 Tax=Kitasatospora sp. NPDC058115 TaxID=3346347 RepID=UPI0036DF285A
MRLRHALGLTVAAATAALGLPGPATAAPADTATTLHVNRNVYYCSDQGPGTVAQPFCTISAAADVVEPGQTVLVWPADYPEQVMIKRSGTPEKPITFLGGSVDTAPFVDSGMPSVGGPKVPSSFALVDVHDVVIRGFRSSAANGLQVNRSSRVVVDQNRFMFSDQRESLRIVGASDHITVSRNSFNLVYGLVVESGAHDILVTGNDFNRPQSTGLTATDVADLAVTNNTFALSCYGGVRVDGDSPRAVVKNNIAVDGTPSSTSCTTPQDGIGVSAQAAPTASVDHNVVHAPTGARPYAWAGTRYASPAAFATATGQGAHDLDLAIDYSSSTPMNPFNKLTVAAAGAIDSADPTAPGVGTDLTGQPAIDHPQVANTGGSTRDRGAHELSGMSGRTMLEVNGKDVPSPTGPTPFTVAARVGFQNTWGTAPAAYLVDFGDGSDPVRTTDPVVQHTYTLPGSSSQYFRITAVAVDATGGRAEPATGSAMVNPDFPFSAGFTATNVGWPYTYQFKLRAMSPYVRTPGTIDFGDGTVQAVPTSEDFVTHSYAAPGTYTVSFTARDQAREKTVTEDVQVTVTPSLAVLKPGERVQALAATSSGLMNSGAHYGYGVWAPFTSVPAGGRPFSEYAVTSAAIGTTADGVAHNVVAADGRVYIADRRMADGTWSTWGEITGNGAAGPLPGGPAQIATAVMGRKLHVLALVGGRVLQATGDWNTGTWSRWGDVTAAAGLPQATRIAAATVGNSLHVVALGANGHVYDADGNYDRGTWNTGDPTSILSRPGKPITDLSAASIGSTLHIVAAAGDGIHQASADYAAGRWNGWGDITAATGPDVGNVKRVSAVTIGNRLHVYALSEGGLLYNATGDYDRGTWSGWGNVSSAVLGPMLNEIAFTAS